MDAPPAASLSLPGRLLVPSISDLFFVLVIVWSFLAAENGWQSLLRDGDTGMHIRVGDLILSTRQVPTHDVFSFSVVGQQWFAFEWLSEVAMAGVHAAWGLKGVTLAAGILLAAAFTILFRHALWQGSQGAIALILTLVTANATSIHFHARPHVFTLLLLAIAAWIVERDRRRPDRLIWLLAPLTILWANLHGGFVILFPYLGLLVIGSAAEGKPVAARRYTLVGAACALGSLINPYGYRLHQHIAQTLGAKWLLSAVDEFKSPSFRSEAMMLFMVMLFAALMLTGRLLARRRIVETLWILFLGYSSLISVRHVTIFMLIVTPIAARELSDLWSAFTAGLPRQSVFRILDESFCRLGSGSMHSSVWIPVFVLWLALTPGLTWPKDFPSNLFPVNMVDRHQERLAAARVFSSDQWNDYLVYRNFPRQRIFIDGRHNYYGEKVITDYVRIEQGHPSWQELMDRYRLDVVLTRPETALVTLLKQSGGWRLIDQDKETMLFARSSL